MRAGGRLNAVCLALSLVLLMAGAQYVALAGPAPQAASATDYRMLQLSDTKYDNCFLAAPHSGNPMFGDTQGWDGGTAWTDCANVYTPTNFPALPGNFTYSVLNQTSGLPVAFTLNSRNGGWQASSTTDCLGPGSGEYSDCAWYYRGEIVFPYDLATSGGNLSGVYGYDTAGSNTETGNKIDVQVPNDESMFFAGCTTGQASIIFPQAIVSGQAWSTCSLSLTHPSLSGSSAAVAIAYNLTIPEQTLSDGSTIPPQYTLVLMQYGNGEWEPFVPSNDAPNPTQYSIVTEGQAPDTYRCLVQTVAPVDLISSGYSDFAYAVQSYDWSPDAGACNTPAVDNGPVTVYVADLNVIGNAQELVSFYPATLPTIGNSPTCGGSSGSSPCFDGFTAMWGDILVYSAGPVDLAGTYYMIDVLHPTNSLEPIALGAGPPASLDMAYSYAFGKATDGSSLAYIQNNSIYVWNGRLGARELVSGMPGEPWVDNEWAAWTVSGQNFTFYDLSNATEAYLLHPRLYTATTPQVYVYYGGGGEPTLDGANALDYVTFGEAYWIANSPNGTSNNFSLGWYNATEARAGHPTGGTVGLGWASDIAQMVVTNGWIYLSALAKGGHNFQVYAIQVPQAEPTTSSTTTASSSVSSVSSGSSSGSTSSSSTSAGSTAATGGGGIPEFTYEPLVAIGFVAVVVAAYISLRRRA